jgi:hypothetical protein
MQRNDTMSFLSPNGHLGFAPLKPESFHAGCEHKPDVIAADSGSDDVGPGPLGGDTSTSPLAWQTQDLEEMLLASRRLGVPMIIGSAGDTGSDSRVDLFVKIIQDLAQKHRLPKFRLGYSYSELNRDDLKRRIAKGVTVAGLDGRAPLTSAEVDDTDHIVAMADIHPYVALLDAGADVIIGGRSSDSAVFAAPAVRAGYPQAQSYFLGKVLECASFCAEPYGAKESVLGVVSADDVKVTAMHPGQRCTIASVAGHAMYERANPFEEFYASGMLDMSECHYEQYDERTTRITGMRFVANQRPQVKLEGAGKVGERFIGMAAVRDPYTIANIDAVIGWAREQVRERFGDSGYSLHYNVFGRDGVMGDMEPLRDHPGHEVCILVQGVAPTRDMAEEVCFIGTRQMFYARLPAVKGTAGGVAFPLDEVVPASPGYRWTVNHVLPLDDPMELFTTRVVEAGV